MSLRGSTRTAAIAAAVGTALLLLALAFGSSRAAADVPIDNYGMAPSTTQAGGHPDLQIAFAVRNSQIQGSNSICDCENVRTLAVHAATGLVGNPHATPQCDAVALAIDRCPVDSQVGVVEVATGNGALTFTAPVFNLVPREDQAGLLGFYAALFNAPILEVFTARTGSDYGLDTRVSVWNGFPLAFTNQILWGVPAAPQHDPLRFALGGEGGLGGGTAIVLSHLCDDSGKRATPSGTNPTAPLSGPDSVTQDCGGFGGSAVDGRPSNSPPNPFLQNPTTCNVATSTSLDVLSYDGGMTHGDATYPPTTGCDQLSFNPSQAIKPTTTEADSPSGADFELTVPQFESPTVPSPSELKEAVVTLPEGFSIAPNLTNGKTTCTDEQAKFGTEDAAECPETSKIGSISVDTPVLPGPLTGYVYLGESKPGDRYRMFLVFDGFGVHVKLPGSVRPDPQTGQIRLFFEDLPQTPFSRFTMHIFGSERGPLATPARCGTYDVSSVFTPWDAVLPSQTSKQIFTIDSGPGGSPCPGATRPFNPGVEAANAGNTAGAHTAFGLDLTRNDGDQILAGLDVATPPGFTGAIKGIPYCPQAAIDQLQSPLYTGYAELASSACPAASRIGTVTAGIGAGSHPLYQNGEIYLAGPYKGAPLSMLIVIPAVSGPYDLGNVTTRAAFHIDPTTAQITTVSDPLPQIVEGIPLRVRQIRLDLDRPGFVINPTDCAASAIWAHVSGAEGAVVDRSANFQVANCSRLDFNPELALRLSGAVKRRGHPAIHATLKANPGDANISRVAVTLPSQELIDQAHLSTPCTRVQFAAGACPPSTILGSAAATTPILDNPLSGPVYLVTSDHALPDLVVTLKGQVDITLRGRIDQQGGGLRTTFAGVPDVPVTDFRLDLAGGKKGLIVNSDPVCSLKSKAKVWMTGQNDRRANSKVKLEAGCGKERKERKGRRAHRRVRASVLSMRKVGG